jgi:membrane protease YdiL (CAAX protease family)
MPLQDNLPTLACLGTWKGAFLALAIAVVIVVLATSAGFGAMAAFDIWVQIDEPRAFAAGETAALLTARVSASLLAFQSVTILLVFAANALLYRTGMTFLSFRMPLGGTRTLIVAVLSLIVFAACYGGLVYAFDSQAFRHDLEPFAGLMQSRTWWLILIAAGVGAPLAEECLFRGLLFEALKATPAGLSGATLLTAGMWALLHANYSVYSLTAIALIGVYLAIIRERTGTLLAPILCHGAYNSLIVLMLAFTPDRALAAG